MFGLAPAEAAGLPSRPTWNPFPHTARSWGSVLRGEESRCLCRNCRAHDQYLQQNRLLYRS